MKRKYIIPVTEKLEVIAEPLLNPGTGVPANGQDDDGGGAKQNPIFSETEETDYWRIRPNKSFWDD